MKMEAFEQKYECTVIGVKAPRKKENMYCVRVHIYRPSEGESNYLYCRKLSNEAIADINELWDDFHAKKK